MMLKIGDVFDLQMGKTPSRKNPDYWVDSDTDWVSISDLNTYSKYVGETKERINQLAIKESGIKVVPKDTVIMSFKLSIGISAITVRETFTNEAIMAFIDKRKRQILPDYFYHQFRTKNWTTDTSKVVMGSTLNKAKLSMCLIKVPSPNEQTFVVEILDKILFLKHKEETLYKRLDELVKSRFTYREVAA